MIIKEEVTHVNSVLQARLAANQHTFVIHASHPELIKETIFSRGLSQIYEEFTGAGRRQENIKQWEKEAEEIISRIMG